MYTLYYTFSWFFMALHAFAISNTERELRDVTESLWNNF